MSNVFVTIRRATLNDANQLLDIDIKCFETAWTVEEWSKVGHSQEYALSVATNFGTPIGFAVFTKNEDSIEVVKLAVKPAYRRKGVSLLLLNAGVDYATSRNIGKLSIIVPESTVYPGERNTSDWLASVGFQAEKPFLKNHFTSYGEPEDGVSFTMPTRRP